MVAFLVLNGGALLVAFLVAGAVGHGRRTSGLVLATFSGYLIVVHSIVLVAGLLGHLTVAGLTVVVTAGLTGALWLTRRADHGAESTDTGERFTAATLFAPLAAIASSVVWAWPQLFQATRLWVWDDYTYHMAYPALWLREHTIAAPTPAHAFTMQAWYPLSASLVATWFMVPFHGSRGDELAWVSLTGLLYAGIVAGGGAELLARLGCRRGAWAVPVVLFATSHRVAVMAGSFSDADLALAAALFGAFAFAIPRGDTEHRRDVRVDTWYAALLTGIALGVKVSAAAPALVIVFMVMRRAARRSPTPRAGFRTRALTALVAAGSWAATGGFWYARNLIHTGNPVYPAGFLMWPGATFPETTLREYSRHWGLRRAVADALVVYLNWPRLHATLAIVGLLGLACWLAFRRRSLTRPRLDFAWGTLAIVAVILILLPVAPYSAGNAMTFRSGFVHWDSMRYIAIVAFLGWVALAFLVDGGAGACHWRGAGAALVAAAGLLTSGIAPLVASGGSVAVALCARPLTRVRIRIDAWPYRGKTLAAGALALVLAGIVVWAQVAKAAAITAAFYREPLFGRAAAVLDRQPRGTRVTVFGDQWVYPAFGARDHLVPVRLDRDGRIATLPIADAMEPGDLTDDGWTFRSNLRTSGIGVVVIVHLPHPGRSPEWPTQVAALEAWGGARLLYRDRSVGVWRLSPEGDPPDAPPPVPAAGPRRYRPVGTTGSPANAGMSSRAKRRSVSEPPVLLRSTYSAPRSRRVWSLTPISSGVP